MALSFPDRIERRGRAVWCVLATHPGGIAVSRRGVPVLVPGPSVGSGRGTCETSVGRRADDRDEEQAGHVAAKRRWLLLTASVLADLLMAVLTIHRAGAWAGLSGPVR